MAARAQSGRWRRGCGRVGCVRYLRAPPPLRRYVGAEGRLWGVGLGRDGSSRGGWAGRGGAGLGKARQSKARQMFCRRYSRGLLGSTAALAEEWEGVVVRCCQAGFTVSSSAGVLRSVRSQPPIRASAPSRCRFGRALRGGAFPSGRAGHVGAAARRCALPRRCPAAVRHAAAALLCSEPRSDRGFLFLCLFCFTDLTRSEMSWTPSCR